MIEKKGLSDPSLPTSYPGNLDVVEREQGKYTLFEVPSTHHFSVGTDFPRDDYIGETLNFQLNGTLNQIVGGSPHMYLLERDGAQTPSFCFISDEPVDGLTQIRESITETVRAKTALPFIQDKITGLFIVPLSPEMIVRISEDTMHVGPRAMSHRNLLSYPLLTRNVLGEKSTLTDDNDLKQFLHSLRYGDILQTGDQVLYSCPILSRDVSLDTQSLFSAIGITPFDEIPRTDSEPVLTRWFNIYGKILGINTPADLLAAYVTRRSVIHTDNHQESFLAWGSSMVGVTPGLFDAVSVDDNGCRTQIKDPDKADILEAVAGGYEADSGLQSKAAIVYKHPDQRYSSYLLVIGGSHPEVQMYVNSLTAEVNSRQNKTYSAPVEIAQLAGTVYFDEPKMPAKHCYDDYKPVPELHVRFVLDTVQDTPYLTVDNQNLLEAITELRINSPVKLELSEALVADLEKPIQHTTPSPETVLWTGKQTLNANNSIFTYSPPNINISNRKKNIF